MPNHTHFMMEPTIVNSLPKIMLKLTLAHTRYFNKKYDRVGHTWQGRYKSSLIDKEDYFIWCGLYNELNPVRAKLVEKPEDWRWSSFNYYGLGLLNDLIDIDPYYLELGNTLEERCKKYKENIDNVIKENFLKNIRKELDEGIFGGDEFIRSMKEKFKIGSVKLRGRPRKNQS